MPIVMRTLRSASEPPAAAAPKFSLVALLLASLNVVTFVLSAILLGVSLYAALLFDEFAGIISRTSLTVVAVSAAAGMLITMLGSYGALYKKRTWLLAFAMLAIVAVFVEAVTGGVLLNYTQITRSALVANASTTSTTLDALLGCAQAMCCAPTDCVLNNASVACIAKVTGYAVCPPAAGVNLPVMGCTVMTNAGVDLSAACVGSACACASSDNYRAAVSSVLTRFAPPAGYVAVAAVIIQILCIMLSIYLLNALGAPPVVVQDKAAAAFV